MFESLKDWMESIEDESRLFLNADDEKLHSALAALVYHFVAADGRHSGREKREFERLMKQEFDLGDDQVSHLWQAAKSASGNLNDDLVTIRSHFKANPAARVNFMQMLLRIINIHGVRPAELDLFFATLHEVFPEVQETGLDAED
jgi:uncharacterized tellurite resistance protein B-like protein